MNNSKSTPDTSTVFQYEFENSQNSVEMYTDGYSNVLVGAPVSKIIFHTVQGLTPDGREIRRSCLNLTIPTAPLLEMCRNILAQGIATNGVLGQQLDIIKATIDSILTDVTATPYAVDEAIANKILKIAGDVNNH